MYIRNIAVPNTLKSKWITEARFALVLAPIDASIAVTHVPIFIPKVTKIALLSDISWVAPCTEHSVMSIDVVAYED